MWCRGMLDDAFRCCFAPAHDLSSCVLLYRTPYASVPCYDDLDSRFVYAYLDDTNAQK